MAMLAMMFNLQSMATPSRPRKLRQYVRVLTKICILKDYKLEGSDEYNVNLILSRLMIIFRAKIVVGMVIMRSSKRRKMMGIWLGERGGFLFIIRFGGWSSSSLLQEKDPAGSNKNG